MPALQAVTSNIDSIKKDALQQKPRLLRRASLMDFRPAGDTLEIARTRRSSDASHVTPDAHKKFLEIFDDYCPLTRTAVKDLSQATFCLADQHIYERDAFRDLILFQGCSGRSPLRTTQSLAQDTRLLGLLPYVGLPSAQKMFGDMIADIMTKVASVAEISVDELDRRLAEAAAQSVQRLQETPGLLLSFSAARSRFVIYHGVDTSGVPYVPLGQMARVLQEAPAAVRQPWFELGASLAPDWPSQMFEHAGNLLLDHVALFEHGLRPEEKRPAFDLPFVFLNAFLASRVGAVPHSLLELSQAAALGARLPRLTPAILQFFNSVEGSEDLQRHEVIQPVSRAVRQAYLSEVCRQRRNHELSLVLRLGSELSLAGILAILTVRMTEDNHPWVARSSAVATSSYLALRAAGSFASARRMHQAFAPALEEHRHEYHNVMLRALAAVIDWPFLMPLLGAVSAVVYGSFLWPQSSASSERAS